MRLAHPVIKEEPIRSDKPIGSDKAVLPGGRVEAVQAAGSGAGRGEGYTVHPHGCGETVCQGLQDNCFLISASISAARLYNPSRPVTGRSARRPTPDSRVTLLLIANTCDTAPCDTAHSHCLGVF